jgi:glyoxylase-like metal-dependent hydrolase (beta-lactamase superfamily II)
VTWSCELGSITLDVFSIGDVSLPLLEAFRGPNESPSREMVISALSSQRVIPLQDLLVRGPEVMLLVDAAAYDIGADSSYAIPGYHPPPSLTEQLRERGVMPADVQHVVITHRHWDHFNGTVVDRDGNLEPTFPNARHYVGRADWEHIQVAMADATSREARVFGTLAVAGLIEVVDGDRIIAPGVTILAAPGETPGHQMVRIESSGEVFLAIGDLIHHPVEIAHPEWMVSWAVAASNRASRARFLTDAALKRARVMASHIPEIGRIVKTGTGAAWESVAAVGVP